MDTFGHQNVVHYLKMSVKVGFNIFCWSLPFLSYLVIRYCKLIEYSIQSYFSSYYNKQIPTELFD